ncbi:unannotated protein [freshwater metagenome]|jgi:hypothetical protein|uniref:Unannotated protein n=1 Tax=freshwater metagenome TaxID=449393 RepID=A0A6J7M0W5_9ZZZZ
MKIHFPEMHKRRAIVATLLTLEGVIVLALGIFLIIKGVTSHIESMSALLGVIVFAFLGGAGLLVAGQGFRAGRNYGRAPSVLANLIALGVAYYQSGAHLWVSAIGLALLALVTLVFTLAVIPSS